MKLAEKLIMLGIAIYLIVSIGLLIYNNIKIQQTQNYIEERLILEAKSDAFYNLLIRTHYEVWKGR